MEQNTFEFENPEVEDVDAYIKSQEFNDALEEAEDLVDSSDQSISSLLRKYSFDERPEVYHQKLKQIGDHHLTYLEDIENDSLTKIFGTSEEKKDDDEGLSLQQLKKVV